MPDRATRTVEITMAKPKNRRWDAADRPKTNAQSMAFLSAFFPLARIRQAALRSSRPLGGRQLWPLEPP